MKNYEQVTGLVSLEELSTESEELNNIVAGITVTTLGITCRKPVIPAPGQEQ